MHSIRFSLNFIKFLTERFGSFDMKESSSRLYKLYFSMKLFNTVVQIDHFSTKFQRSILFILFVIVHVFNYFQKKEKKREKDFTICRKDKDYIRKILTNDCKYTRKIQLSYSEIGIFETIKSKPLKLVLLFSFTTSIFLVQHVYIS